MLFILFSVVVSLLVMTGCSVPQKSKGHSNENLKTTSKESSYHRAQLSFNKADYQKGVAEFEKFLSKASGEAANERQIFWAIHRVGTYYLMENGDFTSAEKFFRRFENDDRLNEAQQDTISEWISACGEWRQEKLRPSMVKNPDTLFRLGKQYFEKGLKRKKFPKDERGDADFGIAVTYLRPLIVEYDHYKNIGEALFMMGRIRYNLQTDSQYWSENFFLKEVIRRFPRTPLARKAWTAYNESVRFGYTGSSGDNTPASVERMLARYKRLAQGSPKIPAKLKGRR